MPLNGDGFWNDWCSLFLCVFVSKDIFYFLFMKEDETLDIDDDDEHEHERTGNSQKHAKIAP